MVDRQTTTRFSPQCSLTEGVQCPCCCGEKTFLNAGGFSDEWSETWWERLKKVVCWTAGIWKDLVCPFCDTWQEDGFSGREGRADDLEMMRCNFLREWLRRWWYFGWRMCRSEPGGVCKLWTISAIWGGTGGMGAQKLKWIGGDYRPRVNIESGFGGLFASEVSDGLHGWEWDN